MSAKRSRFTVRSVNASGLSGPLTSRISLAAASGVSWTRPSAAPLIARCSSSAWVSSSRYPIAPARTAPVTEASSRTLVSAMTSVSGNSDLMVFVASMPSITGISRSIKTTSGLSSRAMATASSPFSASPTNTMSESRERNILKPWHTTP